MEREVLEGDGLIAQVNAHGAEDAQRGIAVVHQVGGPATRAERAFGAQVDADEPGLRGPLLARRTAIPQAHVQHPTKGIAPFDRQGAGEQARRTQHLRAQDVHPAAAEHGQVARRARVAQVVGAHHLRAFQHVVGGVGAGAAHHQVVRLIVGRDHPREGARHAGGVVEHGGIAQALFHRDGPAAHGRGIGAGQRAHREAFERHGRGFQGHLLHGDLAGAQPEVGHLHRAVAHELHAQGMVAHRAFQAEMAGTVGGRSHRGIRPDQHHRGTRQGRSRGGIGHLASHHRRGGLCRQHRGQDQGRQEREAVQRTHRDAKFRSMSVRMAAGSQASRTNDP